MLPPDLITPKAAAKLIGTSISSIYRWVQTGRLRAYRVAGVRYRLSAADVRGLVEEVEVPEAIRTTEEDEAAARAALARMRAAGRRV